MRYRGPNICPGSRGPVSAGRVSSVGVEPRVGTGVAVAAATLAPVSAREHEGQMPDDPA